MHWILIIGAIWITLVLMPAKVIAMTLVALAILTYVAQKTARVITGAEITTSEALRSVGMAFLFLFSYFVLMHLAGGTRGHWGAVIDTGLTLGATGILALLCGFAAAYTAGFKVGMGINVATAAVVALVTSVTSLLLLLAASRIL